MTKPINAWDEVFKHRGRLFTEPHENMSDLVHTLKKSGGTTVLDLGCGTGRHVVYLAKSGFWVTGLDSSPEGIKASLEWLVSENLEADLLLHDMTAPLPFEDGVFDAVISIQVIHHAVISTIHHIVREVSRVLKPNGFLFVTVPTTKNQGNAFERVEENTFLPLDGPEKGLPHHFFTPRELREVFGDFDVKDLHVDSTKHYCLSAFKREKVERSSDEGPVSD